MKLKFKNIFSLFSGALFGFIAPHYSLRLVPLIAMGIGLTFYLNLFQSYLDYRRQTQDMEFKDRSYFVIILPSSQWYQFLKYVMSFLLGIGIVSLARLAVSALFS